MRFPFKPNQTQVRLKGLHDQIPGLLKEIEGLDHALESSHVNDEETPSAHGTAQQLRASILRLELASKRCDLDAVNARIRELEASAPRSQSLEAMGSDEPAAEPAAVTPSYRSHARSRIMLSSLAAVVVLLGLTKIPVDQVAEAQAHIVSALPAVSGNRHEQAEVAPARVDEPTSSLAAQEGANTRQDREMSRLPEPVQMAAAEPVVAPAASAPHDAVGTAAADAVIAPAPPTEEMALDQAGSDVDGLASQDDPATVVEVEVARGSVVTLADVRLREAPGTTARTLRSIRSGSQLAILGTASGWTQVRAPDGLTGWIISGALRPI